MTQDESLRDLYDGCYRRLVAQLYAICGNLGEAEDAVQEAFVRAVEKPRRFAAVDNPEAWLRVVALNVVRSRFRRLNRYRGLLAKEAASTPPIDVPGLSPDHVHLVDALRQLPLEQREAITLHHIVDLPVREVAIQLGVPEGTVKARLTRGRARLAPLVQEFADDIEVEGQVNPRAPVRDATGRWWVVTGEWLSGSRSDIAWTDDRGRTWKHAPLDPENPASTLAVSQNGQTAVATSWGDGATLEKIEAVRLSTDAGRTWRTVQDPPDFRDGGPLAFSDGTALLLGRDSDETKPSSYRISPSGEFTGRSVVAALNSLQGDDRLLYGLVATGPQNLDQGRSVATSTDRGATWRSFEPR